MNRSSVVRIASIVLVVAGLVLGVTAGMQWLILFGVGVFGPVVLRELRVLDDEDELQREAAGRAGQCSFLATGILVVAWIVAKQWGAANFDHDPIPAHAVLACLVVPHFMSRLTAYWGAQRAATRILVAFGVLWLAFVVLSHHGEPGPLGAELLLVLPFFVLAWTCRRWPRVSGALTIAAGVGAFLLFRIDRAFTGDPSALVVGLTFMLPLLVCGIALLRSRDPAWPG